jgi:hypothetical protein
MVVATPGKPCRSRARRAAASGAGLDPGARALFDAPLRWKGQDAEVLIFALPTAGGGQTAVVVAPNCAVLVSFPL